MINFAGVNFKNPVVTASGTFGYGREYESFFDISKLGGITLKGLTLEKRDGNPMPRVWETEQGFLNSIGLQNGGLEYFIKEVWPFVKGIKTNIIANISGYSIEDYLCLVEALSDLENLAMIELNVSCPNVKAGKILFGADEKLLGELIEKCVKIKKKPLMVKLSPNVTDISAMAKVCENAGADALSLVNTFVGMAINLDTMTPAIANVMGGYSGPAIKPIALRMVYEVCRAVKLPVLGLGGIITGEDAAEFMLVGAKLVGVGTASGIDSKASLKVLNGLEKFAKKKKMKIEELTGALK